MTMIPTLQEFEQEAKRRSINRQVYKNLVSFKYTDMTIYKRDWNNVTLRARGITFDSITGKVLARPFDKFFNLEELVNLDTGEYKQTAEVVKKYLGFDNLYNDYIHQKFTVTDKIDGSLGILFYTGQEWLVKTSGAFDSEQAVWANVWCFKKGNIDISLLDKSKTYLFEIIYNEDPHPIKYDFEGLVLLAIIDTETGKEDDYISVKETAERLNVRCTEAIELDDFNELIEYAKTLPNNKEGVVVTFENGFKLKLKGDAYLLLQKVFHNLTKTTIYEHLNWKEIDQNTRLVNSYFDNLIEQIPEELVDMKDYAQQLACSFLFGITFAENIGNRLRDKCGQDRKKAYQLLQNIASELCADDGYKYRDAIMKFYSAGNVTESVRLSVYKALKP